MLVLFTNKKPSDFLASIREKIKDGDITTWKYTIPNSGKSRFDWLERKKGQGRS